MPNNWKFNKGEWAEAYVFMLLIGLGRIYGINAEFRKDTSIYLDVKNILRNEGTHILKFEREKDSNQDVNVKAYDDNEQFCVIASSEFCSLATLFYETIRRSRYRSFEVPEIENFLKELRISSPKAKLSNEFKEQYGAKSDIVVTSIDSYDSCVSTSGFSIKSHIGSAPTLYNASQTSTFIFRVEGCTEQLMHEINVEDSYVGMIEKIKRKGLQLKYIGVGSEVFHINLMMIDSNMDKILADLVLVAAKYMDIVPASNKCTDLVAALAEVNPLGIAQHKAQQFYTAKIKDFLFAAFSGMTASSDWDGRRRMTGGYIDVTDDGDLVYCRALSDDIFLSYLFNSTKIDNPDRGPNKDYAVAFAKKTLSGQILSEEEKHDIFFKPDGKRKPLRADFGYVYKHEDEYRFDINFQIRFQ